MKYTKREVYGMFKRLLNACDKDEAPIKILNNRDEIEYHKGGWSLDFNATYGGYVIEEDLERGGVGHPFGARRRTGREMYLSLDMTCQALENIEHNKEKLILNYEYNTNNNKTNEV